MKRQANKRIVLFDVFKRWFKKMSNFFENKYPRELSEIADEIMSGKPPITYDDILDFFLNLSKLEKRISRNKSKKKDGKAKERRLLKSR